MKIYLSHASQFDYQNELYQPIKTSDIFNRHNFILPHDKSEEPYFSYDDIKQCDLFIAEVSYPSTGQGIEIAWAHSFNKRIICLHKSNTEYSSSLKLVATKFYNYDNTRQLIEILNTQVE